MIAVTKDSQLANVIAVEPQYRADPPRSRRATKAERKDRVELAVELILDGHRTGQIKMIFKERFGVGHCQALRYISYAQSAWLRRRR